MNEKETAGLVRLARKGDAEAFGAVYASLKEDAYRFALYYLHDVHDAADAVQSAAMKAYVNLNKLLKPESFRSWFFTIEANECRRMLRDRSRVVSASDVIEDAPDDSYDSMMLSAELADAMRTLTEEDRMIVWLSVVDGFTSAEIGGIVGLRPGSVRSRLSRALRSMRTLLEKDGANYEG